MLPKLLISYDDMVDSLSWNKLVEALQQGHLLEKAEIGDLLLGPERGVLLNRAAYIPGIGYAVKAECIMSGNAKKQLPTVQGAVLLYSEETGQLRAVIESRLVTQFKTASDSVLGAKLLARPDSRHLVIVGAGAVAASIARAYSSTFPELERISIWARRPEQAHSLVNTLQDVCTPISVVEALELAVAEADIVSTATLSREPLILRSWVRPGTHVDLIGAFMPDMREADDALIEDSTLFVDCTTTTRHVGDIAGPIASGVITENHIQGDLYDLVRSTLPARKNENDITVFKNGGGAHLDLMTANYIVNVANTFS